MHNTTKKSTRVKITSLQIARKGAIQLFASVTMAILTLVQITFLARYFEFRDLGFVATQLLVISIATMFCDFGWEGFIIQERGSMLRVALIVGNALPRLVGLALGADVLALAIAWLIGAGNGTFPYLTLLLLLPVLPLIVVLGALQAFAVKGVDIGRLSLTEAGGKLVGVLVTIAVAWRFHSTNCVTIGFLCTVLFKFCLMTRFHSKVMSAMIASCTRARRKSKLYAYAVTQMLSQVIDIFGNKADEMIVASSMPIELFGIYASIKQIVIQAISFANPIIRRLTMPYFSRDRLIDGTLNRHTISILAWSNAAYIVFFLGLAISSGLLTEWVLGKRFLPYVDLFTALSVLWSVRAFAGGTISAFLQSTGKPFRDLTWTATQVGMQLIVMRNTIQFGLLTMIACACVSCAVMAVLYHIRFYMKYADYTVGQVARWVLLPTATYYLLGATTIQTLRKLSLPYESQLFAAAAFVGCVLIFMRRVHRIGPGIGESSV
jgi:O-antigen/teichoic acid export membrane protein